MLDYSLSDVVMYSPEVYFRLLERYNAEVWPLQIAALFMGLVLIFLVHRGGITPARIVTGVLALVWLWVAYSFHVKRYATIQIAANYFALMFAIQAGLLVWMGVLRCRMRFTLNARPTSLAGLGIVVVGVFLYPAIQWWLERSWMSVDVFALTPDPTIVATVGFLLFSITRVPWLLLVIPVIWTIVSGALSWELKAYENLVAPALVLSALIFATVQAKPANRSGKA